jgi:hypothetical protein
LCDLPRWWGGDAFFEFKPKHQIVLGEKELFIDGMMMQ